MMAVRTLNSVSVVLSKAPKVFDTLALMFCLISLVFVIHIHNLVYWTTFQIELCLKLEKQKTTNIISNATLDSVLREN